MQFIWLTPQSEIDRASFACAKAKLWMMINERDIESSHMYVRMYNSMAETNEDNHSAVWIKMHAMLFLVRQFGQGHEEIANIFMNNCGYIDICHDDDLQVLASQLCV